jgi:hypothetical protein
VSEEVKWESVFGSNNDKVQTNALYLSQNFLANGQGFSLFVKFMSSTNRNCALNSLKALANFARDGRSIFSLVSFPEAR